MRLSLSSAAAPDLPLSELLEACRRRGLSGLELVVGHAHGLTGGGPASETARERIEGAGVALIALADPDGDDPLGEVLRTAASLGVPALVTPGPQPDAAVVEALSRHATGGGSALLMHGTDPKAAAALRSLAERLPSGCASLAWEVDPARDDPAWVPAVLRAAGDRLGYVRLRGGGPETARQTGLGVGALMAQLALSRFSGPIVLAPGTPRFHYAWKAWLGRAGGWGCGSKQSDPGLVTLPVASP